MTKLMITVTVLSGFTFMGFLTIVSGIAPLDQMIGRPSLVEASIGLGAIYLLHVVGAAAALCLPMVFGYAASEIFKDRD